MWYSLRSGISLLGIFEKVAMKKVLIIGYLHPLTLPPGGGFALLPLARHLHKFGWQPFVLSPPLREKPDLQFTIIETPYRDALAFWKKLLRYNPNEGQDLREQVKRRLGVKSNRSLIDFAITLGNEIFAYPDAEKGWKPFAINAAKQLLQHENIDAMLSCQPVISHLIASELKAKYKIPWIADFPDLWSQNANYQCGPLRKFLDRRLELKTLSTADALVTVSQPNAEKLSKLHKGKTVYVITNGFDPAEVNEPPANLTPKFTITYTGIIYAGKQDPSKLFAALKDLIAEGVIDSADIEVRFYGTELAWLDKDIEQYGLSAIVKQYKRVPREVALEKQRESQLLLLLKWEDPQERGVYPAKIFEYLAARRPMLSTGGSNDVVTELVNETKAGIDAPTIPDIKDALEKLYHEYRLKGKIVYDGRKSEIDKYSHYEMTRKFSEALNLFSTR
jgi:glycosyltransferase involved in cell wall biosynthesis